MAALGRSKQRREKRRKRACLAHFYEQRQKKKKESATLEQEKWCRPRAWERRGKKGKGKWTIFSPPAPQKKALNHYTVGGEVRASSPREKEKEKRMVGAVFLSNSIGSEKETDSNLAFRR